MKSTALAYTDLPEAALYFDHVIPMLYFTEILRHDTPDKNTKNTLPAGIGAQLLPASFLADPVFIQRLLAVNEKGAYWILEMVRREHGWTPNPDRTHLEPHETEDVAHSWHSFVSDFHLQDMPVVCGEASVSDSDTEAADFALTLSSLRLIDAEKASWEKIMEFRKDADSRPKLRRLRLFFMETYKDKPRSFVEDDLHNRIAAYDQAVKDWGFETRTAAFSMLFSSKFLAGALGGSALCVLAGASEVAIVSSLGGVAWELGRISIEISKQRFQGRKALRDNPISNVATARQRLQTGT
ncbi:MAG: hypothetical protein HY016_01840 [Nitrosomonadales bacterium]|nr:hypothetical protein [Nitrosomonadales bacterium]